MADDRDKPETSSSKQRVFPCPICKKGFSQKGNMKRHIPTHAVEKPYRCSECDKAYSTKYELKKHIETHTDGSHFQCPLCRKTFTRSFNLQKHLLTHPGAVPEYLDDPAAETSQDARDLDSEMTENVIETKCLDKNKTENRKTKQLNKQVKENIEKAVCRDEQMTEFNDSAEIKAVEVKGTAVYTDEKITETNKNKDCLDKQVTETNSAKYQDKDKTENIEKIKYLDVPRENDQAKNSSSDDGRENITEISSLSNGKSCLLNTGCAEQLTSDRNASDSYCDILLCDQEIHKSPEKDGPKEGKVSVLPGEGVDMYLKKELSDYEKKESVKPFNAVHTQGTSRILYDESFTLNPFRDEGSEKLSFLPGKGVDDYLQLELLDIRGGNIKGFDPVSSRNFRQNMATGNFNVDKIIDEQRVREAWLTYIDKISILSIKEEIRNKIDNVKPDKSHHDTDGNTESTLKGQSIRKSDSVMSVNESDEYSKVDDSEIEDVTQGQPSQVSHSIPGVPRSISKESYSSRISQRVKKKPHKFPRMSANNLEKSRIYRVIPKAPSITEAPKNISEESHITDVPQDMPEVSHNVPKLSLNRSPQQKNFHCQHCNKGFVCEKFLKRHIINHHGHHQCSVCQRSYQSLRHLKRHMLNHTREYQCPMCDKVFAQKGNMKRHALTHGDEKPHQCSECGRKYITKYELKRHLHTHTEENPFYCSVCLKKFTNSKHFERHILLHAKIKPRSHSECDKSFSDSLRDKTDTLSHCSAVTTESQG